jgi:broad-specificity NMP kinase
MQQVACKNMSRTIENNHMLDEELKTWQQDIDNRRKALEDLASKSNIVDKAKLEEDLEKVNFVFFSHAI